MRPGAGTNRAAISTGESCLAGTVLLGLAAAVMLSLLKSKVCPSSESCPCSKTYPIAECGHPRPRRVPRRRGPAATLGRDISTGAGRRDETGGGEGVAAARRSADVAGPQARVPAMLGREPEGEHGNESR